MNMEVWTKIAQFLLSLSILVVLHELGHFTFAKLFKTRVEKFYLFFNPWFSLFKFKHKDTEYGIGWLPLGGYVKISGMIDESLDTEQLKTEPQPYEFRAKPAWQRLIIIIGGVLVNFVLAFIIYIAILFTWGEEYLATKDVTYGVMVDSVGEKLGLRNGDKILTVGGETCENFMHVIPDLVLNQVNDIEVEREGQKITLPISAEMRNDLLSTPNFLLPRVPFVIDRIEKDSPADKAGFKSDDKVMMVDSIEIIYYDQFKSYVPEKAGKAITVTVEREGKNIAIPVTVNGSGQIGVSANFVLDKFFHVSVQQYTLWESIPAGITRGGEMLVSYMKQLKLLVTPGSSAYKSLGGFITIGKIFPSSWDWHAFWNMTALLSIVLAIMNILPIPALDGGYVIFILYEMITGRKPGEKFLEYAQITGMVLLFALLFFANANDVIKLFN
ncbi:RIP metalloprotease RseP [Williamwhitmania taraxaci]|uniref:Zinc metalloprotease n=1 Tax=Williamwhitmania taraxaci TaxID=1640674 RepID=A0A1G6R0N3_9BACT|nr:RIP metalloprotease RseP [Williamwhitmania taraxaci]SDC98003.1 regulator of sigma E protease [Williamwhitmania taraxaci]